MRLMLGDCLEVLKTISDNSVDAVVTDPPYGLSFMGKKWDYDVPKVEIWQECLRVLKPGGYLLSFAGTRTQHRMAVRIEDAGFEIRDMIAWVYGSGFPKSLNIGKAVDRLQGNEREKVGETVSGKILRANGQNERPYQQGLDRITTDQTKGTSEWEGWGTALKPALEPITVARKPIEGNVAQNCLKWGVGGINIDGCRVGTEERFNAPAGNKAGGNSLNMSAVGMPQDANGTTAIGRFPANLIHDGSDEVVACFPKTKSTQRKNPSDTISKPNIDFGGGWKSADNEYNDSGSAARFFYTAKASKSERNRGLDCYLTVKYNSSLCKEENTVAVQLLKRVISDSEVVSFSTGESGENITVQCHKDSLSTILTEISKTIELKTLPSLMHLLTNESTLGANLETENGGNHVESVGNLKKWLLTITKGSLESALGVSRVVSETLSLISVRENWKESTNFHSTVKPISLMEYLVKLVSKEGHTVLDPFMGSGSTGIACKKLGREFIGIELEPDYVEIAKARISAAEVRPEQEVLL